MLIPLAIPATLLLLLLRLTSLISTFFLGDNDVVDAAASAISVTVNFTTISTSHQRCTTSALANKERK